ncbi:MAG TPA: TadE family protein [Kineosporiaceae bacterium]|jgi:Flp pilus assembly protein TadG|nr:TadE family protein [Kineosporiaceae bacterium]
MGRARRAPRDEGAAAVEFAIVAPLLFIFLFWTFEFGWGMWEMQAGASSAREVARSAALGSVTNPPTAFVKDSACLAARNGTNAGHLTKIKVAFTSDAAGQHVLSGTDLAGYVAVTLTYRSTLSGLLPTPLAPGGEYQSVAVAGLESLPGQDLLSGFEATPPLDPCS